MRRRPWSRSSILASAPTAGLLAAWVLGAFGQGSIGVPLPGGLQVVASTRGGVLEASVFTLAPARRGIFGSAWTPWRGGCTGPCARWDNVLTGPEAFAGLARATVAARGCHAGIVGWVPVLACGGMTRLWRRRAAPAPHACAGCGYDLRGLGAGARCPECGGADHQARTIFPSCSPASRRA